MTLKDEKKDSKGKAMMASFEILNQNNNMKFEIRKIF